MKVADGFEVKLFASEPEIRQPVSMYFDERGRMWVIQYLQYPNPAGLTPVKIDQYLRTTYDRLPEPPPKGPKGADRITICEDTDGDGRADRFKDFVGGLNLTTGLAVGYGGVFVLQTPYLLFYPDRNRDDVPDGDPEVLLSRFGMEDAHALANSLQWGPDGWLYGTQGSTVTANIRGIEFQQGIWRYHPVTKEFELFSEGGGNTWGLDFDQDGNAIAGTNFGEQIALHQVQGAYHLKNFGKHGELHNPYAFGYFDHIPYKGFKGGHVTCGGIVYQGGSFPQEFRNTYIAANLLANSVYWHVIEPKGSSFTGRFGGELLLANDIWFRPVDCALGPDGSVFVADWCDQRATHVDPTDNWDRSNGRIYKIEAKGTKPPAKFDLSKLSSNELIDLLAHRNDWFSREALRILAERRDSKTTPSLREAVLRGSDERLTLRSLWALNAVGGFDEPLAETLLNHPHENVRAWTIRLLGDGRRVSLVLQKGFVAAARSDSSPMVRSQLACTSKRLPGKDALPILHELLRRSDDLGDLHIPMLLWWALEDKTISDRAGVLSLFSSRETWKAPIVRQFLIERVARRYAMEGKEADLETCARFIELAPGPDEAALVLRGIETAFAGRRLGKIPPALESALNRLSKERPSDMTLIRLALRLGNEQVQGRALQLMSDRSVPEADRISLIEIVGQVNYEGAIPALLELLGGAERKSTQFASLLALQRFSNPQVATKVLDLYPRMPADVRTRMRVLLFSRPGWAREFLRAVENGVVEPKEVAFDQLRQISLHHDPELDRLVAKHWGKVQSESEGIKRARVGGVMSVLGQGKGDPVRGKPLFQQICGICHTMFGEGNNIGPDLTGADRKNRDLMLTSIIDPSVIIRKEYVHHEVTTKDDRALSGLLVESTPKTVTILDRNNQRTILARDEIKELRESSVSLMPEGILDPLQPQQIRDLISYLQSDAPAAQK
jgi:putative membrane-bound dehydrogenase-like protein